MIIHLVSTLLNESFNSCPREGAIKGIKKMTYAEFKFQLMPPRGGNQTVGQYTNLIDKVSTHAPARGQSSLYLSFLHRIRCFNSCPREGAILPSLA